MKSFLFLLLLTIINSGVVCFVFTNPIHDRNFPDPFILNDGSALYAYATNGDKHKIPCIVSSSGLPTEWKEIGDCLSNTPDWSTGANIWAPSVLRVNSSFYVMYYVVQHKSAMKQCISVATAHSAAGPFVDRTKEPFVCQLDVGGSIDPSYLRNFDSTNSDVDANELHLVWKNDGNCCKFPVHIWSQKLSPDGLELRGTAKALITNDLPWEGILVEGPSMISIQNTFLLFYCANDYASYQYAIGYAVCTTPQGPCTKVSYSPVVGNAWNVWGPGGPEFFTAPSSSSSNSETLFISYHGWTAPDDQYPKGKRSLRMDKISFLAPVNNPTKQWVVRVEGPSFLPVNATLPFLY